MIVLDASAGVELLLGTRKGAAVDARLRSDGAVHAPHLFDLEVLNVVRRLERGQVISGARAALAVQELAELRMVRHPHLPFAERVWQFRANLTAYDAVYVALAEGLEATLLTTDHILATAPKVHARIDLV